ncbi:MAG: threonine synthase [Candidatus Zambryskibacteria bacterium]|nr:threonine synthase [Candidatus Zambryskibacteria bacterium]
MKEKKNISFTSTRNRKLNIDFWQSIAQGVAPDGGLLVPNKLPKLTNTVLKNKNFWETSRINNISNIIHRPFIPREKISDNDLASMMSKAHNFDLPLQKLDDCTFILRIDTGPTASFKDIAARSLASLLGQYCLKHNTVINIIVATSGDTGVAIADAFGDSSRVTVTILYPDGGVSEIQEKQMIDVHNRYKNIQAIPVKGNFDTCQDIAKLLQAAREFTTTDKKKVKNFLQEIEYKLGVKISNDDVRKLIEIVRTLHLSSANSINIWRLIPQMTQYFVAYGKLIKNKKIKVGEQIIFAVPSGNLGHLMAGLYAKTVGLPIKKFVIATNANNILANIIGSGTIKHHLFSKTSSPSMDILDPSNLERLLYFAAQQDKKPRAIDFIKMKNDIKKANDTESITSLLKYGVTKTMLTYLQKLIWAEDIETDEEVYSMMEKVARINHTTMEPHGTTALIATIRARAKQAISNNDIVVVMETAHPDKFPDALKEANIKVAQKHKHKKLTQLAKISISKMNKPNSVAVDILLIAKKIKSISY